MSVSEEFVERILLEGEFRRLITKFLEEGRVVGKPIRFGRVKLILRSGDYLC